MARQRKVISEEQGEEILRRREEHALEELRELGFRIGLWEPRAYLEPDPLRGIEGGYRVGTCYVVADSTTGKKKTISAMSAVDALDQARAWLRYQEERLAPDLRFVIAKGESVATPVIHRVSGDTAQTAARRAATSRRLISFQSGIAEVVDAHGSPIGDTGRASQFRDS